ncbi:GNAT family N-acetyltransferase [Thioalkalivibrio sp. ALJ9]|uniref:GNAT family N-acetyltransferase n=1 Tax=Thioalkalivibrio sp. ALJ9 TaxID=1158758 RepID=UPI00037FAC4B|nr:GNAT family N-acetyltransferase [Thioalkalivibrio sp. ALJ9]
MDWLEKLRLHEVSAEFSDGHEYLAREWVELERRKCLTGRMACFLIEYESEFHGSVCLMREGRAIRIKNLYLQPASRGHGIGSLALQEIFGAYVRSADSAAVVYAMRGEPGEHLYRSQNMVEICRQYEWTRRVRVPPEGAALLRRTA